MPAWMGGGSGAGSRSGTVEAHPSGVEADA
jgi:hypothetical protein